MTLGYSKHFRMTVTYRGPKYTVSQPRSIFHNAAQLITVQKTREEKPRTRPWRDLLRRQGKVLTEISFRPRFITLGREAHYWSNSDTVEGSLWWFRPALSWSVRWLARHLLDIQAHTKKWKYGSGMDIVRIFVVGSLPTTEARPPRDCDPSSTSCVIVPLQWTLQRYATWRNVFAVPLPLP